MEQTTGKRLIELRKAKGLSVEEFAAKLGVKPSAVYGLQSDANKPSFDTLASIVQHFPDVSMDWLLTGTGPMLRDGRALSPAPVAAAVAPVAVSTSRPAPLETQDGQVDFVQRYISKLEADLEAERARVSQLLAMLGKPSGNLSYAAEPAAAYYVPTSAAPIGPRFDDCLVVAMWPDAGSAEVTPLRQAN